MDTKFFVNALGNSYKPDLALFSVSNCRRWQEMEAVLRRPLRVVVALSGGVDSAVAALLLQRYAPNATIDLVASAHMTNWTSESELDCVPASTSAKGEAASAASFPLGCGAELQAARNVAAHLGLPFHHCEFEAPFFDQVFRPMVQAFSSGGSFNPDVYCNRVVKFGLFADHVLRKFDADCIATGHYARNQFWTFSRSLANRALEDRDPVAETTAAQGHSDTPFSFDAAPCVMQPFAAATNDQSYFLARVPRSKFARVLFPNSELTKVQARALAARHGLSVAGKTTSTGVCFIGKRPFQQFVAAHAGSLLPGDGDDTSSNATVVSLPGPVVDARSRDPIDGAVVHHGKPLVPSVGGGAQHPGVSRYTEGQKVMIKTQAGSTKAWYVAAKHLATNTLAVVDAWDHDLLFTKTVSLTEYEGDEVPNETTLYFVGRHLQPPVKCTITRPAAADAAAGCFVVTITEGRGVRAVSAGQVGVVYGQFASDPGLRLVGSGIIVGK
jgi:tRNA U34 2-thiouridine synthase MnmA/TrmU